MVTSSIEWSKSRSDIRGRFIVFEGFDGVGKTSQLTLLANHIRRIGRPVLCTRQPTDEYRSNPFVRKFLDSSGDPSSDDAHELAILSARDRSMHSSAVIVPALRAGIDVLCDRYLFSALAFFQARGISEETILRLNVALPRPNLTIYLDLDAQQIMARLKRRDDEKLKREERDLLYVKSVLNHFKRYAHEYLIVNASNPLEEIHNQITEAYESI